MLWPALQLLCWKCARIILIVPIRRQTTLPVLLSLILETRYASLDPMGCTKACLPLISALSTKHMAGEGPSPGHSCSLVTHLVIKDTIALREGPGLGGSAVFLLQTFPVDTAADIVLTALSPL